MEIPCGTLGTVWRNKMNIFEKMSAITAELGTVAKNLSVDTGKGKGYKAVSERDVIDAVKPIEAKHGIFSYPSSREVIESELLESENQYGKKTTFFSRIKTEYTFVNIEKPDEKITMTVFSEGFDTQDKGSGKAMTYGDKYALMKAYKISTGDDPDQTASAEENYKAYSPSNKSNSAVTCENCGHIVSAFVKPDGSMMPVSEVVATAKKKYGKTLCTDCMTKIKNESRT